MRFFVFIHASLVGVLRRMVGQLGPKSGRGAEVRPEAASPSDFDETRCNWHDLMPRSTILASHGAGGTQIWPTPPNFGRNCPRRGRDQPNLAELGPTLPKPTYFDVDVAESGLQLVEAGLRPKSSET